MNEETKVKKLFILRYEVMVDYPDSPYPVGRVLVDNGQPYFTIQKKDKGPHWTTMIKNIHQYPDVFRKMDWWEKRTIEEMPKKLKILHITDENNNPVVCEIAEWDMRGPVGYKDKGGTIVLAGWPGYCGYLPTT